MKETELMIKKAALVSNIKDLVSKFELETGAQIINLDVDFIGMLIDSDLLDEWDGLFGEKPHSYTDHSLIGNTIPLDKLLPLNK